MERLPFDFEKFKRRAKSYKDSKNDYSEEELLRTIRWVYAESSIRNELDSDFKMLFSNIENFQNKYEYKKSEEAPIEIKKAFFDEDGAEVKCEVARRLDKETTKYVYDEIAKKLEIFEFTNNTDIFVKAYALLRRIYISHYYYCNGGPFSLLKRARYKKDVARVMDFVRKATRDLTIGRDVEQYKFTLRTLTENIQKRYPLPDEHGAIDAVDAYIVELAEYVCEKQKIFGKVDPSTYEEIMDLLAEMRTYLNTVVCCSYSEEAWDCAKEVVKLINFFTEKSYREDFKEYSALEKAFGIIKYKWSNCSLTYNKTSVAFSVSIRKLEELRKFKSALRVIDDFLCYIFNHRDKICNMLKENFAEEWTSLEWDETRKILDLQRIEMLGEISKADADMTKMKYIEQTNDELRQLLAEVNMELDNYLGIDEIFVALDAVRRKFYVAIQNDDVEAVLSISNDIEAIHPSLIIDMLDFNISNNDFSNDLIDGLRILFEKYLDAGGNDE